MNSPLRKNSSIVNVHCGSGVVVVDPSNLYGCILGNDVFVGTFVEIQNGVYIGAKTRIQSHSFICELVNIGENCFIAHGVMFINDAFELGGPAAGDKSRWKSTNIGNFINQITRI